MAYPVPTKAFLQPSSDTAMASPCSTLSAPISQAHCQKWRQKLVQVCAISTLKVNVVIVQTATAVHRERQINLPKQPLFVWNETHSVDTAMWVQDGLQWVLFYCEAFQWLLENARGNSVHQKCHSCPYRTLLQHPLSKNCWVILVTLVKMISPFSSGLLPQEEVKRSGEIHKIMSLHLLISCPLSTQNRAVGFSWWEGTADSATAALLSQLWLQRPTEAG